MFDIQAFLIVGGLASIITICCGGVHAVRSVSFYLLLLAVTFFATIIVARYDDLVSNSFNFDGDGIRLVIGAQVAGIVLGFVVMFVIEQIAYVHARRKMLKRMEQNLFPTPASRMKREIAVQDPRISRSTHRRLLDINA